LPTVGDGYCRHTASQCRCQSAAPVPRRAEVPPYAADGAWWNACTPCRCRITRFTERLPKSPQNIHEAGSK